MKYISSRDPFSFYKILVSKIIDELENSDGEKSKMYLNPYKNDYRLKSMKDKFGRVASIALPGFTKEEVKVFTTKNILSIEVEPDPSLDPNVENGMSFRDPLRVQYLLDEMEYVDTVKFENCVLTVHTSMNYEEDEEEKTFYSIT